MQKIKLKYHHIQLFSVSGILLPVDIDELPLVDNGFGAAKAYLTRSPDIWCLNISRGSALMLMMGKGRLRNAGQKEFNEELHEELERISDGIRKNCEGKPVLVIEIAGDTELDTSHPINDIGEFVLCNDGIDTPTIRKQTADVTNTIITSLYIASNKDFEIKKITSGLHLTDTDGKVYYSYSFSMSGKGFISTTVDDKLTEKTSEYAQKISKSNLSKKIIRLMTQALDENDDLLKSFLFAWSALEIFIQKVFKDYNQRFFDLILRDNPPALTKKYFERLNHVMRDKYRINDKFIVVASLFCEKSAEQDLDEFNKIKKIRDLFFHGEEISEEELPVEETLELLKKYMQSYYDNIGK